MTQVRSLSLLHLSVLVHVSSADNIAPPIAACLGDFVTMSLLGAMSTVLTLGSGTAAPYAVIVFVTLCAIACIVVVRRNEHVRPLLGVGWTPLLGAMVITSLSGVVLDTFVSRYEGYAILAVAFGGAWLVEAYLRRADTPHRYPRRRRINLCFASINIIARSCVSHRAACRVQGGQKIRAQSAPRHALAVRHLDPRRDRLLLYPARLVVARHAILVHPSCALFPLRYREFCFANVCHQLTIS